MNKSKMKEIERIKNEIKDRKKLIDEFEEHIDEIDDLKHKALGALQELENYLDDIEVLYAIDSLTKSQSESYSIRMSMDTLYNEELNQLEKNLSEEAVEYENEIVDLEVELEQLEEEIEEEKTKTKKKEIGR